MAGPFQRLHREFQWALPQRYNIAWDILTKHVGQSPDAPALIVADGRAEIDRFSFRRLDRLANQWANVLVAQGFQRGDRLVIMLPQSPDVLIAHCGAFKAGVITVPVSVLFGPEALLHRLRDSGARGVVATEELAERLLPLKDQLPGLKAIWTVDGAGSFRTAMDAAADAFEALPSGPDDPALMIYTSGTTGLPKGALHGHRVLLGHLPGIALAQDQGLGGPGELMWTPADWAWAGGLLNALLPSLHFGTPVLIHKMSRFDPELAVEVLARHGVTRAFLPPTALRMIRAADVKIDPKRLALQAVGSAGEALGTEAHLWAREAFGRPVNEFYGQTECNAVIGSSQSLGVWQAGSMGQPVPGHRVALIDEAGREVPPGTVGEIAIARPDPVMFLGYWQQPQATAAKFRGDWMTTGDLAVADDDGYIRFLGRNDDVINSAGYRIGPTEIEDCLAGHPLVRAAVVIGKADTLRAQIVKAFVVLKDEAEGTEALKSEIQAFVRTRLSAHEFPREIEFIDDIPMTTSGKVIRRGFREGN